MKNCLIIVPHPDDEINIAGGIFDQLTHKGYIVTVAMATYGDYISKNASIRVKEAFKAKTILGYDNLIFLGYGDDYINGHIYEDKEGNRIYKSHAGREKTYCVGNIKPYHFSKTGIHNFYSRLNLKNDIKDLILDLLPQLIICIDVDNHPDHRAVSLLTDEVLGELIKEYNYHPIILKKFAYLGVYKGHNDYYTHFNNPTKPSFFKLENVDYSYPNLWEERICIPTNSNLIPILFWKSKIYKALKAHKSQSAHTKFGRIVNSDSIFWIRRTDNLALKSKISATSGDVSYLNDFKITDTDNIKNLQLVLVPSIKNVWKPNLSDKQPEIRIIFSQPTNVSFLKIYQNQESKIEEIRIDTDKGTSIDYKLQYSYLVNVKLPHLNNIRMLKITILRGRNININEIEVYKNDDKVYRRKIIAYNQISATIHRSHLKITFCYVLYQMMLCSYVCKKYIVRIINKIKKIINYT